MPCDKPAAFKGGITRVIGLNSKEEDALKQAYYNLTNEEGEVVCFVSGFVS
jgi:hypothetical protein